MNAGPSGFGRCGSGNPETSHAAWFASPFERLTMTCWHLLLLSGHAPVSKGLVLASIGATVIQSAARSSHRRLLQPLVASSKALAFKSGGELLFGCVLM